MADLTMWLVLSLSAALGGADARSWELVPSFVLGEEIVYRGSVSRMTIGEHGAAHEEVLDLAASLIVLDIDLDRSAELGCQTELRPPRSEIAEDEVEAPGVVRFDLVKVSASGQAAWALAREPVTLPPGTWVPWELGYLFNLPRGPVTLGSRWVQRDPGQPPIHCEVEDVEPVEGLACLRIAAEQHSPRREGEAVRPGDWLVRTKVWIDGTSGLVQRLDRHRQFCHVDGSLKKEVVRYQLSTRARYEGERLQNVIADFRLAHRMQAEFEAARGDRQARSRLARIQRELDAALAKSTATPYRSALRRIHEELKQAIAAEDAPQPVQPVVFESRGAAVGERARAFVARDVESGQTISLQSLRDRWVLVAFVDPGVDVSLRPLRAVLDWLARNPRPDVRVVAVCPEPRVAANLRHQLPGPYSICTSHAVDGSYGIDLLPHTLIIDPQGILRGNHVGWGPEVQAAVERLLALPDPVPGTTRSVKPPTYVR